MKTTNDKMLTNAALAFVMAILVALLVQGWLAPDYASSNLQVHEKILDQSVLVLPAELKQMQEDGSLASYTLVDLGEMPVLKVSGASSIVHIPFNMLLEKNSFKQLKKAEKILLFGTEETQAMMAGQLLMSKGLMNVKVASNSIDFNDKWISGSFDPTKAEYSNEKARFDYNRYFKGAAGGTKRASAPAGIPQGIKVVKAAGGC